MSAPLSTRTRICYDTTPYTVNGMVFSAFISDFSASLHISSASLSSLSRLFFIPSIILDGIVVNRFLISGNPVVELLHPTSWSLQYVYVSTSGYISSVPLIICGAGPVDTLQGPWHELREWRWSYALPGTVSVIIVISDVSSSSLAPSEIFMCLMIRFLIPTWPDLIAVCGTQSQIPEPQLQWWANEE